MSVFRNAFWETSVLEVTGTPCGPRSFETQMSVIVPNISTLKASFRDSVSVCCKE